MESYEHAMPASDNEFQLETGKTLLALKVDGYEVSCVVWKLTNICGF